MFVVLLYASETADVDRLIYGMDWRGKTCGKDLLNGREKLFWPNPFYYQQLQGVCMEACPQSVVSNVTSASEIVCTCNNQLTVGQSGKTKLAPFGCEYSSFQTYAVEDSIQNAETYIGEKCATKSAKALGYFIVEQSSCSQYLLWPYLPLGALGSTNKYTLDLTGKYAGKINVPTCNYMYRTKDVLNRCVPFLTLEEMKSLFSITECDTSSTASNVTCQQNDISKYYGGITKGIEDAISDIGKCDMILLGSIGVAIILSFVFLTLMKFCASCIIFCGLILVILGLAVATGACYLYYGSLKTQTEIVPQLATYDTDTRNMNISFLLMCIFGITTAVMLCIVICMLKKIRVACTVIALAADGVMDMPLLIMYPIGMALILLIFYIIWIGGALYIWTAGDIVPDAVYGYGEFAYDMQLQGAALYWFFGLFWIGEFISATGFMVVAMCFCIWFFTPVPGPHDKPPICERVEYTDEPTGEMSQGLICAQEEKTTYCPAPCCCIVPCGGHKKAVYEELEVPGGGLGKKGNGFEKMFSILLEKETNEDADLDTKQLEEMREQRKNLEAQNLFLEKEHEKYMDGRSIAPMTGRLLPPCILAKAIKCTVLHHLGTTAFGSLIIAIIQALRAALEYIEQKQKNMTKATGVQPPMIWKALFCYFRLCLWCLEKCMRYINTNAYILTCINGSWFCCSACHAMRILITKIDYIFISITISTAMLMFGKLSIALATGCFCAYFGKSVPDIKSVAAPAALATLIGFAIALIFMQVFQMGIDTILMCYLEADFQDMPLRTLPPSIRKFVSGAEMSYHDKQNSKKK